MIPRTSIFLTSIIFPIFLAAQSPYTIDWKKEPYFIGFSVGSYVSNYLPASDKDPFTLDEIFLLDRADVNHFDRRTTFRNAQWAGTGSDILLYSSFALPVLATFSKRGISDFDKILLMYGETFLATKGMTLLSNRLVRRPRPFVYDELANLAKKQTKQARNSFFSDHTALTAANCFFAARVLADYYPDSRLRKRLWIGAATIPAVVGFFRMQAGEDYFLDVLAGYSLGAIVGFLVPHLHRNKNNDRLGIYPGANGALITWRFNK